MQPQPGMFAVEEEWAGPRGTGTTPATIHIFRAAAGITEGRFTTEWDLGSGERELASPGAALLGVVGCERSTTSTRSLGEAGRAG